MSEQVGKTRWHIYGQQIWAIREIWDGDSRLRAEAFNGEIWAPFEEGQGWDAIPRVTDGAWTVQDIAA